MGSSTSVGHGRKGLSEIFCTSKLTTVPTACPRSFLFSGLCFHHEFAFDEPRSSSTV